MPVNLDPWDKAMFEEQPDYRSYLLRLWRVRDNDETSWRASLESAQSGEREGFASLEELFDFIRRQTTTSPAADEAES